MKKRILSLFLTVALMLGVVSMTSVSVSAASSMKASEELIALLKQMEGFVKYPIFDYSQYSVGYGSRCPDEDYERYMKDGITEEEADELLRVYVAMAEKAVNKLIDTYSLKLNQYQFDALIDFCYNCGTSWTLDSTSNFRAAVINGATGTEFLNAIVAWCQAGNKVLDGLIKRRLAEANLYFNGIYDTAPPSNYCYVIFNPNGGTSGTDVRAFQSGEVITDLPTATRPDYNFAGWYTTATKNGTKVTSIDSSMSGKTVYARWENLDGTPIPDPEEKPVNYQRIVRVDTSLNVREEPDVSAAPVKSLYDGDVVTIVAELQGTDLLWGKLSTGGWIALKYTEPYPEETEEPDPEPEPEPEPDPEPEEPETPSGTTVTVTGSVVNVRSGAGTNNSVISSVYSGQTVTITEVTDVSGTKWGKLSTGGWICLTYTNYSAGGSGGSSGGAGSSTTVKVTNGPLNIRNGAGTSNAVISTANNGQSFTITEVKTVSGQAWGKISTGGWICLVYTDYSAGSGGSTGGGTGSSSVTVKVTGSAVNVRTGAGTNHSVSTVVYSGTSVTIVETTTVSGAAWGRLSTGGWICLTYTDYSGASSGSSSGGSGSGTSVKVTGSAVNVRSGAGTSNAVISTVYSGQNVTITDVTTVSGQPWGKLSTGGWICLTYTNYSGGSSGGSSTGTYTVTASAVNVRSGSNLSSSVISCVYKGQSVTIVNQASGDGLTWGQLSTGGWICMSYVK